MIDDRDHRDVPLGSVDHLTADGILQPTVADPPDTDGGKTSVSLVADIIIANAPDPVFVSDLEDKILQANDARLPHG